MSNSNPLFEGGVIPDVIKELPTQNLGLEVSYGNQIITAGATIPRNVTTEVPDLKITNLANKSADASPKYTIIMTDPDLFIKNDPTGQHWLQTGLTASSAGLFTATEPAITPYLERAPGPGLEHRYAFILAEEPITPAYSVNQLSQKFPSRSGTYDLKDRMRFYAQQLIDEEGLKVVGVTYMQVGPNLHSLVDNMKLGVQSVEFLVASIRLVI